MSQEKITLYYREGSSDKVYQTELVPTGGGWAVNFAYGRRGSTLKTGSKTTRPIPYEQAKLVYDKLVREKTAKGYTPGADGTPYKHTDNQNRDTGIRPQLLNPVEEKDVLVLLADDVWCLQEKFDGKRLLVRKDSAGVVGINRKGLVVGLPEPIHDALAILRDNFVLDGEVVGEQYWVFDCLSFNSTNIAQQPYSDRWRMAFNKLPQGGTHVQIVPTAASTWIKQNLFQRLAQTNKEGVVFKRHDAPYTPGRPNSGGTQLKFKFLATASVLVTAINKNKRSVAIGVYDDAQKLIPIGNVTIPAKTAIPQAGAILEVRYLYCFKGGSLYQPVYLDVRDDIEPAACAVKQLKFRAADLEDET